MSKEIKTHRDYLQEELDEILGNKIWRGSDFRAAENILLLPHRVQLVPIRLTADNFGPFLKVRSPKKSTKAKAKPHTRSRVAQAGGEVDPWMEDMLYRLSDYQFDQLQEGDEVLSKIRMINHSHTALKIGEGMGIGFIGRKDVRPLTGNKLYEEFLNGGIKFTGEEGRDWSRIADSNGNLLAIDFLINQETAQMIDPVLDELWLPQYGSFRDARKFYEDHKIPWDGEEGFYTVMTKSERTIRKGLCGILQPLLRTEGLHLPMSYQLNSFFIEGGRENHDIILEIVEKRNFSKYEKGQPPRKFTKPKLIPTHVRMEVYEEAA